MDNLVPQLGIPYIGIRNCETKICHAVYQSLVLSYTGLYNYRVHTSGKYAKSIFIFRPVRVARYLKVALRCWKCEQSSHPFRLEIRL